MECSTSSISLLKNPVTSPLKISSTAPRRDERLQEDSVIDRIHEHADQQSRHLHPQRAEDDATNPALRLHHAARLDGHHLPDKEMCSISAWLWVGNLLYVMRGFWVCRAAHE